MSQATFDIQQGITVRLLFIFSHHRHMHHSPTRATNQPQARVPGGLVVRIRRSHRRGRGSIPRLGMKNIFKTLDVIN